MLGEVLDRSIVFSFDRTGFARHAKSFDPSALDVSLAGKRCLVTGASSGLGMEVARGLAEREADVHLLCRNREKAEDTRETLRRITGSSRIDVGLVDLSDFASIHDYAKDSRGPPIDVLVHNAGVLPAERQTTADGLELTVATNLVGPFLLTRLLWPRLARGARLIHVSSGGMYAERLDVDRLFDPPEPFDGVRAYAQTKRAQVVLSEILARRSSLAVSSMHPGWADTPGVQSSLPRFHRWTRRILRTPAQGADTIVWLASAEAAARPEGRFFFDRSATRAHLSRRTLESDAERRRLFRTLCRRTGADPEKDFR